MTPREALENIISAVDKVLDKTPDGQYGIWSDCTEIAKALTAAKEVLGKPVRNCDVGTDSEQAKRMEEFCNSHGHGFDGQKCYACENCKFISVDRCELAWAQLPYEKGDET